MLRRFHLSAVTTVAFLALVTLACEAFLQAQNATSSGVVSGQVTDPSGAVIAGAAIVLTNTSNGYKQTSVSNNDGLFSFPAVPTGVYNLAASKPSFKLVQVTNVNASVGETTRSVSEK
jgi:hypothetical protein